MKTAGTLVNRLRSSSDAAIEAEKEVAVLVRGISAGPGVKAWQESAIHRPRENQCSWEALPSSVLRRSKRRFLRGLRACSCVVAIARATFVVLRGVSPAIKPTSWRKSRFEEVTIFEYCCCHRGKERKPPFSTKPWRLRCCSTKTWVLHMHTLCFRWTFSRRMLITKGMNVWYAVSLFWTFKLYLWRRNFHASLPVPSESISCSLCIYL